MVGKRRLYVAVALTFITSLAMTSCRRAAPTAPSDLPAGIEGLEIRPSGATLTSLGATRSLQLVATTPNGFVDVTSRSVWTSANPAVATVDATGLLTAHTYGTTTISATVPSVSKVAPPRPVDISVVDGQTIAGPYRVTFKASKSCQLPPEAMSRTYAANMIIDDRGVNVVLSGARFWDGYGQTWNTFLLMLHPESVTFQIYDLDTASDSWGGGIAEQLSDTEYLEFYGTGEAATVAPSFTATFAGTFSVQLALVSTTSNVIATCTAPDHQVVFTRLSGLP